MKISYERETLAIVTVLMLCISVMSCAAPKGKAYESPDAAVEDFVGAVRKENVEALTAILGPDSQRLFPSEDPVADKNLREEFLRLYDQKHALQPEGDSTRILLVGADSWPMPIPLVKSSAGWTFDTEAGMDEIINRRIGRNELSAIQTCLAVGDAEREYYRSDRDGDDILEYAQTFRSSPGQKNGLFWPVAEGEPQSPIGELVAMAADQGYGPEHNAYHGYHYKLLTSQGAAAAGGSYDYVVGKDQIGGFAVVAFPTAYGDSGIMTFLVSHEGTVYQKDLGEKTEAEASKLTSFNPDGWEKVDKQDLALIPAP
jgi:hypothetical protein